MAGALLGNHFNPERDVGDLKPDEPCWRLFEWNEQVPGKGLRRIQVVQVPRGEKMYEFSADLGAASSFHALPLDIAGGVQEDLWPHRMKIFHRVGDLMEIAEVAREQPLDDNTIEHFETAPDTFAEDVLKADHESVMMNARRSVFGRYFKKER